MQILPTGRPMMSVSGVWKRAYSTTPSLTFWLPLFPARSATTAAVARGFNVETITPAGAAAAPAAGGDIRGKPPPAGGGGKRCWLGPPVYTRPPPAPPPPPPAT